MNENVENLVLEHLRIIRADLSSMKDELSGARAELLIMRQHMAGLSGGRTLHDVEIAGPKMRPDRTEERLELAE